MRWLDGVRARLDQSLRRSAAENRTQEEIQFHLEMETEKNVRAGMPRDEARRRALIDFGGVESHREELRAGRRVPVVEDLWQDAGYAFRSLLRRSPGFTAVAVLTIALGVGATTALFTAADALLLRPFPGTEPDRLLEVAAEPGEGPFSGLRSFSFPQYEAMSRQTRTLEGLAARRSQRLNLGDDEYSEEVRAAFVTPNYFQVLGIGPSHGRLFMPEAGDPRSTGGGAVLSHAYWRSRFGGDPAVVGETVRLNGSPVPVAGIADPAFTGTSLTQTVDVWVPLSLHEQVVPNSDAYSAMSYGLSAVGRLGAGIEAGQAEAELSAIARALNEEIPGPVTLGGVMLRGVSRIPADHEGAILQFVGLLAISSTLVLLIASTNVAGMLLLRARVRVREVAVRAAIGATRGRLVRQLCTEGVILFLLGGLGGVLLATWLTRLLLAFRWPIPVGLDLRLDLRALAFALALSAVVGILFSLLPAVRASRSEVGAVLKGTSRGGESTGRLSSVLVVGQIAMSVLLLVAAGLFLRSLQQSLSIDPGFDPAGVRVASIDLHRLQYPEPVGRALYESIVERAERVPGVESASLVVNVPLGPGGESLRIEPVGGGSDAEGEFVLTSIVGADYFRTMRMPVIRGRGFTAADLPDAPSVAIVNESLARRFWPGEDPIGKRIRQTFSAMAMLTGGNADADQPEFTVVGVVTDGKYGSMTEEPQPFLHLPLAQNYRSQVVLAMRTNGPSAEVAAAVREQVKALDPALPLLSLTPLDDLIRDQFLPQRIGSVLTTLFGMTGLVLALVGLFGVMAYSVVQRTREIGIRLALGARREFVLRSVLRRGAELSLTGIAIGLTGALAATRWIASFLSGVSPTDPLTFAAVSALLIAGALLASYLPALRAARVDPLIAIRHE